MVRPGLAPPRFTFASRARTLVENASSFCLRSKHGCKQGRARMNESRPQSMSAFWMPFTNNRDFKADPRLLVSAEGMYYKDVDGNGILDGTAGLWCVPCGHAQPRITAAVSEMVGQLDFAPTFQMGHPA